MLAKAGPMPSTDSGWAYEFKWDGVRAISYVDDEGLRAYSRGDKDLAKGFPELADLGTTLGATSAVLDGEIVAFDDAGRPSFGRLQHRLNLVSPAAIAQRASDVPATYLVFDLLELDGESTMGLAYDERRERLAALDLNGSTFATPPAFTDAHGSDVLAAAESGGLEGIVAKRRDSIYRPGARTSDWVKLKIVKSQEVVIGGWTEGEGGRAGSLGALLLGVNEDDALRYVGKVGTGFDARSRRELLAALRPLGSAETPFDPASGPAAGDGVHFVEPRIVGEVSYGEWTAAGHLRHTSWRGLRIDKQPAEVSRES
jgi:bifunctional non-homologous end joining protein LigD